MRKVDTYSTGSSRVRYLHLIFIFIFTLLLVNLPGSTPQPSALQLPDGVRNFILYFYRNVLENNVYELHNVYDSSFNKLTNKYYQKQPWPEAELIAPLVNDGKARRMGKDRKGKTNVSSCVVVDSM